jgi:sugar O-acyltransferase (sialic acid O-acetyltransferase NeuD family)
MDTPASGFDSGTATGLKPDNGLRPAAEAPPVLVIGAGGHSRVVISSLVASGRSVVGVVDEDPALQGGYVLGAQVIGGLDYIPKYAGCEAVIAVGDNNKRRELAHRLQLKWTVAVHPGAIVDPDARLGPGTVVFAGAVVQPGSRIGSHVIINTAATVDHDCMVEDYAHLAPGSHLGGSVWVGEGAFLGLGACVLPNLRIGDWAVLGAGAAAIHDVPPYIVAVGVPCRNLEQPAWQRRISEPKEPTWVSKSGEDALFIDPSDSRWIAALQRGPHDFYHLPKYVALCAREGHVDPVAFLAQDGADGCLLPFLRQPAPAKAPGSERWCDLVSPYGYPGPVWMDTAIERIPGFLERLREAADRIGACSILIRLHPLLNVRSWEPLPTRLSALVEHGETVSVDLTQSEEELWNQTRDSHRYEIRRLWKLGYKAEMDNWGLYPDFQRSYWQTMQRLKAEAGYFFAETYFRDLKAALDNRLHLCTVSAPDGRLAAAALFTAVNGIMQYHLSASESEFQRLAPSKLVLHCARSWGKQQGCTVLHLGGGVGGIKDKLFDFKAGFSDRRHTFRTFRMIVNERRYAVIASRAGLPDNPEADVQGVYFPPYLARHASLRVGRGNE